MNLTDIFDFFRISQIKQENEQLKASKIELQNKLDSLGVQNIIKQKKDLTNLTKNYLPKIQLWQV